MKKYSFFSGVILALIAFACLAPIYNPPTGGGSESDPVFLAAKDTDGTLAANSDSKWATQKATKTALDAKGPPPSDTAYDATSWDGVTTVAPSKNAVRDEMEGKQTAAQVQALIDAAVPYKVYAALLTQSGTDAPVATVLQNTLGGAVVWSYSATGTYAGVLTGAFAGTVPYYHIINYYSGAGLVQHMVTVEKGDSDSMIVRSYNDTESILSDGELGANGPMLIDIKVFP